MSVRSIDSESNQYVSGDILTMDNCYYLSDTATATITEQTGTTAQSFADLSSLSIAGFSKATAINSHPFRSVLVGSAFPFLAIVSADGSVVHYGDWYVPEVTGLSLPEEDPGPVPSELEMTEDASNSGEDETNPGEDESSLSNDDTAPNKDDATLNPELNDADSGIDIGGSQ